MQKLVHMRIEGVSPVLMHNPAGSMKVAGGDQQLERAGKQIPAPEVEARNGLYVSTENPGRLYIPSDAVREAALIAAADFRDPERKGRTTLTRRFGASVFLSQVEFPLFRADSGKPITDAEDDWTTFVKRVVVQRNGVMRGRAQVSNWATEVEFEYDEDGIQVGLIVATVNRAGKYPGLLDYRPAKKGPFGRFKVTHWEGSPVEFQSDGLMVVGE